MKSKIYGFKDYDEEYLYYCEANTHAICTLRGLIEYFEGFKEQAEMNPWEYQGLESLKDLKKGIELLKEAEKCIRQAEGGE